MKVEIETKINTLTVRWYSNSERTNLKLMR